MLGINRQVTLASRPVGFPKLSDFHLVYSPMHHPGAGEVLVRVIYVSLDPNLRERLSGAELDSRLVAIGEVLHGSAVALVVESLDPAFLAGDTVEGMLGWQEFTVAQGCELRALDRGLAPVSTALGVLGLPGLTAYFGLLEIADPQPGETVVVSEAAGAVGMIAGQIARIRGCRVVGVASSDAETSWLRDELGFDAAVNPRSDPDWCSRLMELCPDGIDVYFDNEGGAVTDAVMRLLNPRARISICGQVSQYNLKKPEVGPRWLGQLIVKQAKMQGFLVSGFTERFAEGLEQLATWLERGQVTYHEDITQGIESAPQAFIGMLQGKGQGLQLVRISEV